jgi:hypothetical protein
MRQTTIPTTAESYSAKPDWVWETPKEAGRRLKYSTSTLAKMRMRGDGPKYSKTPNGRIRYRSDWSDEWAAAGTRASTSDDVSRHAA